MMEEVERVIKKAQPESKSTIRRRKKAAKFSYSTETPEKAKKFYYKRIVRHLILLLILASVLSGVITVSGYFEFSRNMSRIKYNNASNYADAAAVNSYDVDKTYSFRTVVDLTKDVIVDTSVYGNACVQLYNSRSEFVCSSSETVIFYENSTELYKQAMNYCTGVMRQSGVSDEYISDAKTQRRLQELASASGKCGFIYLNTDISKKAEIEAEITDALSGGGKIELVCTLSNILRSQPYATGIKILRADGRSSQYVSDSVLKSPGVFTLTLNAKECTVVKNSGDTFSIDFNFLNMMPYSDEERDALTRQLKRQNKEYIINDFRKNPLFFLKLSKRVTEVSRQLLSPTAIKSLNESGSYNSDLLYKKKIFKKEIFGYEYIYLEPISVLNGQGDAPAVLDSKTLKSVLQLDSTATSQVYGTYALQQYSYSYIGSSKELQKLRAAGSIDDRNVYTIAYVYDYYPVLSAIHQIRNASMDEYTILFSVWLFFCFLIIFSQLIKLSRRQRQLAENAEATAEHEWTLSDRTKSLASRQGELLQLLAGEAKSTSSFAGKYSDNICLLLSQSAGSSLALEQLTLAVYLSRNEIQLSKATISLSDVARETVRGCERLADKKNIALRMTADSSCRIYADRYMLTRAISYLVLHALDMSEDGSEISIVAHREESQIALTVKYSTGTGQPEQLTWEPFGTKAGTGLGLYIAKELFALHGGECSHTTDEHFTQLNVMLESVD